MSDLFGPRRKRVRAEKGMGAPETRVELRGSVKMRDYLMDVTRDLRQIRLPFSVNQVGVYYEVLLAGTEKIRQRRDLVRAVEEHGRGPFGGPIKKGAPWIELEKYKNIRGYGIERHHGVPPLSPTSFLRADSKTLTRCPTPPPASSLFIGFLENDKSHWPGFMEHLDTRNLSRWSLTSSLLETSSDENDDDDGSDPATSDSVSPLLPLKPLTAAQSLLDHPGQIERGKVVPSRFRWYHGDLQPDRYTPEMTRFAVMLQRELHFAENHQDVRRRIRRRRGDPVKLSDKTDVKKSSSNIPPAVMEHILGSPLRSSQCADTGYPLLPEFPFILSSAAYEPLTSFSEEQYLFKHCWCPRGLAKHDAMALDLPLQYAWDIGRRGCFTKMTVMTKAGGRFKDYPRWFLWYLVMDGTEDDGFLSYYTWTDNRFRDYDVPKKIGTISVLDVRDAIWDFRRREVRIQCDAGTQAQSTIIIHAMTLPFFSALITCTRHNEALRQLNRIRRQRYFLRTYDIEVSYLTALRDMLLHTKALMWQDHYTAQRRQYEDSEPTPELSD